MSKRRCAIIGSGNIGTDLLMKMGIETTHQGIEGLVGADFFKDIDVVFDATSANAHIMHARILQECGKRVVDLTPAAVGPYVVPVANFEEHLNAPNINMVTCGGQATIPIVHAVSSVAPVHYAEIVASISSRSAGPGTRANIDEFTETTARALEVVGKAKKGKAIIVLNPAEPPLIMRDTVFCLTERGHEKAIEESIQKIVVDVQQYVPGYRLVQDLVFEDVHVSMPGEKSISGLKVTALLEVKGAGDYLPEYAGNLDIMTSAARAIGEKMVA